MATLRKHKPAGLQRVVSVRNLLLTLFSVLAGTGIFRFCRQKRDLYSVHYGRHVAYSKPGIAVHKPSWAAIALCQPYNHNFCITTSEGQHVQSQPPINVSCGSRLVDGFWLAVLSLPYERIIVHTPGVELLPVHYQALHMQDVVFHQPSNHSRIWAASPRRHHHFFETGCDLIEEQLAKGDATLHDLFAALSWGAAYFPAESSGATERSMSQQVAFATFLSSAQHDWYVESVRLMQYRLRKFCHPSAPPFIIMLLRHNNVTRSFIDLLEQEDMQIIFVDDIATDFNRDGRFHGIWGKQRVWQLPYDLIVFIDPDQLLLQCPRSMTSYPGFSHARVTDWQNASKVEFNSGTLVIKPNNTTMTEIESLVRASGLVNDQELTAKYFAGRGYAFPEASSLWKRHSYLNPKLWNIWKHCAYFFHYTGEKPWEPPPVAGTEPTVYAFFAAYQEFKQDVPLGPRFTIPFSDDVLAGAESVDVTMCPY